MKNKKTASQGGVHGQEDTVLCALLSCPEPVTGNNPYKRFHHEGCRIQYWKAVRKIASEALANNKDVLQVTCIEGVFAIEA